MHLQATADQHWAEYDFEMAVDIFHPHLSRPSPYILVACWRSFKAVFDSDFS